MKDVELSDSTEREKLEDELWIWEAQKKENDKNIDLSKKEIDSLMTIWGKKKLSVFNWFLFWNVNSNVNAQVLHHSKKQNNLG